MIMRANGAIQVITRSIVIHSRSVDIEIFGITVGLVSSSLIKFLHNGVEKHRKGLWLTTIPISKQLMICLLGFYFFREPLDFFGKERQGSFKSVGEICIHAV